MTKMDDFVRVPAKCGWLGKPAWYRRSCMHAYYVARNLSLEVLSMSFLPPPFFHPLFFLAIPFPSFPKSTYRGSGLGLQLWATWTWSGAEPRPQMHFTQFGLSKRVSWQHFESSVYNGNGCYENVFVCSVAMGLFHEWAGCCSILSTHLNPALG